MRNRRSWIRWSARAYVWVCSRLAYRIWWYANVTRLASMGREKCIVQGDFTFENVHIGNDVVIGPGARFWACRSKIFIGDKVMFGPDCCIIGGDHDITKLGRFMADVTDDEKDPSKDADVVVEQD